MAQFTLTIDCDNAAFEDEGPYHNNAENEIARILRAAADDIGRFGVDHTITDVRDINGNTVGTYNLKK